MIRSPDRFQALKLMVTAVYAVLNSDNSLARRLILRRDSKRCNQRGISAGWLSNSAKTTVFVRGPTHALNDETVALNL